MLFLYMCVRESSRIKQDIREYPTLTREIVLDQNSFS